jgi:dCMP deaminase
MTDGSYVENTTSCAMCKRLVINAGIEKVVVRKDANNHVVFNVQDWIDNDDSLTEEMGY